MKKYLGIAAVALPLAMSGCQPFMSGFTTACADIASMPPAAVAALNAQDPHSAIGVLWADAKSACVAGLPAVGVDQSWGGMIWGELKVLIPQLLPSLIPILI